MRAARDITALGIETDFLDQLIEQGGVGCTFKLYDHIIQRVAAAFPKAMRKVFEDNDVSKFTVAHPDDDGLVANAKRHITPSHIGAHGPIVLFDLAVDVASWPHTEVLCCYDTVPIGTAYVTKRSHDKVSYSLSHNQSQNFVERASMQTRY